MPPTDPRTDAPGEVYDLGQLRERNLRTRAELRDGRPDWFRIVRAEAVGNQPADGGAAGPSTADVYVYESIGGWFGTTADDFVRDVAGLDVDHIDLHLNSPGGDVFEGVAIANVLRQHRADVTVWVDGLAASVASVIAMAGDQVVMGIGSQLMIHDAWTVGVGNAADLRKTADTLDSVCASIASTYAARAGGTGEDWRAVMQAETWYTAEEAVTAGLADRVATADDAGRASGEQIVPGSSSSLFDWWDAAGDADRHVAALRSLYAHAGRAEAPAPAIPAHAGRPETPAASAAGDPPHPERSRVVAFSPEQLDTMRTSLGLSADADESAILSALTARTAEPAAPGLPDGVTVIDATTLADLQAAARRGDEAARRQEREDREALVAAAITDGRIAPARRDAWLNSLAADPGAADTLARLEKGLVPVDERGHAGDADESTTATTLEEVRASAAYKSWSF